MTNKTEKNDIGKGTLTLLGGWEMMSATGHIVTFPAHEKGRALLAYLATEDRWHYREALGDLLWPESPAPRANLRQALSVLRAALDDAGAPCLLIQRNMVRFSPDASFMPDVTRFAGQTSVCSNHEPAGICSACFNDTEQMAARYKGEFMAGFSLPDCPDFEVWLQAKRDAFHRRALTLLARLANRLETDNATAAALSHARRYVELEPWDESGQLRLMRLYAAAGNSGAAIKQFEEYRRQLHAELGTAPGKETRTLYEQLRKTVHEEAAKPSPSPLRIAPERRQVTVLYCEMRVAGDDPEEIAAILQAPRQRAIDLIRSSGGFCAQSHGAGLLAYFGYPRSMEDAAVLAARAALALSRSIPGEASPRFGLHAGLIVTGTDTAIPDAAGQISACAIRLCHAADAGEIRLSPAAQALVTGYFRCEPACVDRPTEAWRLLEETGAIARLEAATCLTPLVGRTREIARLTTLWRTALGGAGARAVLLRGDPGIGKSRLIQHFAQLAEIQPAAVREMYCRPEYQNSAFHPLIRHLEKAAGFSFDDSNAMKRDKLERHLEAGHMGTGQDALALLADLLAVPGADSNAPPAVSPQQERENRIALLLRMVQQQAARQPQLLIVEDLHWADPSMLEWLDRLLDGVGTAPLFVLLTARPEFQPGWQGKTIPIDLPPLTDQEAAALVGLVDTQNTVPAETVARVVKATDGIPLFIEETARMLIADARPASPDSTVIPATLRDLLASRLDRLAEAKPLIQMCAAIGREFSSDLLDVLTPLTPADTASALCRLEESGLISRIGISGVTTYQFRHALIQEAAYQSQTRAARRETHRRIAHALKTQAAHWGQEPEVLAKHFFEAGDAGEAVAWWHKAGAAAAGRGNFTEAIEHFRCALGALPALPADAQQDELELSILVELGSALIPSKGYGSPEADQVYSRALALSEKCGASLGLFRSIWGLYLGASSRTTHSNAMLLAQRLLQLAQQDGDPALLITAHYACANSSYSLAHFAQACRHGQAARRLYCPELDARLLALFGEHTFVSTLLFEAWALWTRGHSGQALETANRAVSIAKRVDHAPTMGFAYCLTGILHRLRGEPEKAKEFAGALLELAATHNFPFWQATGNCLLGWAQAAEGDSRGVGRIAAAIDAMRSGIFVGALMYIQEMLVEAYHLLNRHEEQLRALDEALNIMHDIHDRHFEAELYRLKGECLLKLSGDIPRARQWLERSRTVARSQGAMELERRAIASLDWMEHQCAETTAELALSANSRALTGA